MITESILQGTPFGLILLDYHMPNLDGVEFARQLAARADELTHGPIVMLSSSFAGLSSPQMRQLGINRYLTKPVIASELRDVILDVMGIEHEKKTHPLQQDQSLRLAPRKILLVEDGIVNQRVALGFLNKWGHHVELAVDGREAIHALDRESFDVVLMDIQMPEMNGYEATAVIRDREAGTQRHQHIVAMTAEAMKGDRESCLAAGMDDYVSKPFDIADLQRALAKSPVSVGLREADQDEMASETSEASVFNASATVLSEVDDTDDTDSEESPSQAWQTVLDRTGGDPAIANQLADAFVEEATQLLPTMRDQLTSVDVKGLYRSAHTLKGAAGCLGAERVAASAQRLETQARSEDLGNAGWMLDELVRCTRSYLNDLNHSRSSHPLSS